MMKGIDTAKRLFTELARQTADAPGVTRASFGSGESLAHNMIIAEAQRIGLEHVVDAIGNLYVTLQGLNRSSPCLMIGSHLDSVPHGGNYDGAAGVIAGLTMLEALIDEPVPPFDITVMAVRAEEMIWFPVHYLGSRAAFGLLPADTATRVSRSDTGLSLEHHMLEAGFSPDVIVQQEPTLSAKSIRCFLELHIEQGPVLVEHDIPVGIVSAIRGNKRYRYCSIEGQTTHAGGVPRRCRRDAVMAGAELINKLEQKWIKLESLSKDLVLTVGEFFTDRAQHGITKVPGRVDFTLDFRSSHSDVLDTFDAYLHETANHISKNRGVSIKLHESIQASEAIMDSQLIKELTQAANQCEVPFQLMASGGGHDCAVFAEQDIPSAMLFVRNYHGSHSPDEHMDMQDFEAACKVMLNWLIQHIDNA
jgi:N-carbamoyl-L-amino-acid hydrolase